MQLLHTTCMPFASQDRLRDRLKQSDVPHTVLHDQPYMSICNLRGRSSQAAICSSRQSQLCIAALSITAQVVTVILIKAS